MRNRLQVLLSVMDKDDSLHYVDMLNIRTDVLIINQCGNDDEYEQDNYGALKRERIHMRNYHQSCQKDDHVCRKERAKK